MPEIELEIRGATELKQALRDYPKISAPILQKAIVATQFIFQKHTLKNDPVPWRTGNLLQSFRFRTGTLHARWFPTARYAPFVEYGTRPHAIYPRAARALAWQKGGTGRYTVAASGRSYYRAGQGTMVFAAHVNHPGTKAQPFIAKIARKARPDVDKLMVQALDIVNREVAKRTLQR